MTLDAESAELVRQTLAVRRQPTHTLPVDAIRALGEQRMQMYGAGPPMWEVTEHVVVVDDTGAQIPIRVLNPSAAPIGVITYLHGGGWVAGSIDEYESLGREIARRTNCAVALVGYRKAPEHPFPIPVDDAWRALLWIDRNLEDLAGRRVPLAVGGDSAGGNLAAAVVRRARDRRQPQIALQLLVYPVLDADLDRASYHEPENQLLLTRDSMAFYWGLYVPNPAARVHEDASPLRLEDPAGLPDALILTAEHDILRDEGEAYAAALRAAGVDVEHRRFEGQMHGFLPMRSLLPGSELGLAFIAEAVSRRLGRLPTDYEGMQEQ